MSRSEYLRPVYAVQRTMTFDVPHYDPRSEALLTESVPRLWSAKHAARAAAKKHLHFARQEGTVVEFRLVTPEEYELLRRVQREQEKEA